jgi:hypothetical protein
MRRPGNMFRRTFICACAVWRWEYLVIVSLSIEVTEKFTISGAITPNWANSLLEINNQGCSHKVVTFLYSIFYHHFH